MARRRYLVAYDIADPVRLRRVCTLMEDHGDRLQYRLSHSDYCRRYPADSGWLLAYWGRIDVQFHQHSRFELLGAGNQQRDRTVGDLARGRNCH